MVRLDVARNQEARRRECVVGVREMSVRADHRNLEWFGLGEPMGDDRLTERQKG